jgi:hypothetical protein
MRKLLSLQDACFHFDTHRIKKIFLCFTVIAIIVSIFNIAHSFQLTLAWDPNSEPDLAGYKLYSGTESGKYGQGVDVGKNESVTLSGLALSKAYYFAITAYDLQENESDFSDEISVYLCSCDLNNDGICNGLDWLMFFPSWGRTDCNESDAEPCGCDLSRDGNCNGLDWLMFFPDWDKTECNHAGVDPL